MARGMDGATAHTSALMALEEMMTRQAMVIAFEKTFYLTGVMMLVLLPLAFFLRDRTR